MREIIGHLVAWPTTLWTGVAHIHHHSNNKKQNKVQDIHDQSSLSFYLSCNRLPKGSIASAILKNTVHYCRSFRGLRLGRRFLFFSCILSRSLWASSYLPKRLDSPHKSAIFASITMLSKPCVNESRAYGVVGEATSLSFGINYRISSPSHNAFIQGATA